MSGKGGRKRKKRSDSVYVAPGLDGKNHFAVLEAWSYQLPEVVENQTKHMMDQLPYVPRAGTVV